MAHKDCGRFMDAEDYRDHLPCVKCEPPPSRKDTVKLDAAEVRRRVARMMDTLPPPPEQTDDHGRSHIRPRPVRP